MLRILVPCTRNNFPHLKGYGGTICMDIVESYSRIPWFFDLLGMVSLTGKCPASPALWAGSFTSVMKTTLT